MLNRGVTDPSARWTRAKLDAGDDAPPFAAMEIYGREAVSGDGSQDGVTYLVRKPESDGCTVLLNGPTPLQGGTYGQGTRTDPASAYYYAPDGVPVSGEMWGAAAGEWAVRKGRRGFVILGGPTGSSVVDVGRSGGEADAGGDDTVQVRGAPLVGDVSTSLPSDGSTPDDPDYAYCSVTLLADTAYVVRAYGSVTAVAQAGPPTAGSEYGSAYASAAVSLLDSGTFLFDSIRGGPNPIALAEIRTTQPPGGPQQTTGAGFGTAGGSGGFHTVAGYGEWFFPPEASDHQISLRLSLRPTEAPPNPADPTANADDPTLFGGGSAFWGVAGRCKFWLSAEAVCCPDDWEFTEELPRLVTGLVYGDKDADEVYEPGGPDFELPLGGRQVTATGTGGEVVRATTGPTGLYSIRLPSTPDDWDIEVALRPGETCAHAVQAVTFPDGTGDPDTVEDIDFGIVLPPEVRGMVFRDRDADGVRDDGEPGLAGRLVVAAPTGGGTGTSAVTGGGGNYVLALAPGVYSISTPPRPGETAHPGAIVETIAAGQDNVAGRDLGLARADIEVSGRLYVDLDDNGAFGGADFGVANWPVAATWEGAGGPESAAATTDADGLYAIPGVEAESDVTVQPVGGGPWTPASRDYTSPASDVDITGADFRVRLGEVTFEGTLSDAPGGLSVVVAGRTVEIYRGATLVGSGVTDGVGFYSITVRPAPNGLYTWEVVLAVGETCDPVEGTYTYTGPAPATTTQDFELDA